MDDLITSYVNLFLRERKAGQTKNQRFDMWAWSSGECDACADLNRHTQHVVYTRQHMEAQQG